MTMWVRTLLMCLVVLAAAGPADIRPLDSSAAATETAGDAGPPTGYDLVWSDEFALDGPPNETRWGYDTEANATGWYNDELQYYADARPENARVRDGRLIITARHEALASEGDYGGQAYTSARLITRDTATWTYGFFEIRAKLPCGAGTWPAIWMLGAGDRPYPSNGEIDIMEQVGRDPTGITGTIHDTATAGTPGDGGATEILDACTTFHDYQLTWTPDRLVIGVDGRPFHVYANPGAGPDAWPFDEPQYLLLNLAIGGELGGPVDDRIFPVSMEIAYVRVYQQN